MLCWYTELSSNTTYSAIPNDVALCLSNVFIVIFGLYLNGYVVYCYHRTRRRQPVSSTTLLLLASFSFTQCAFVQPIFITFVAMQYFGYRSCFVLAIVDVTLCVFLGYLFLEVTFLSTTERLISILFPIFHRVHIRKMHLVYLSAFLFLVWALLSIIVHLLHSEFVYLYAIYAIVMFFGLVYTPTSYVKIFSVARKSQKELLKTTVRSSTEGAGALATVTLGQGISQTTTTAAVKSFNFTRQERRTAMRMLAIIAVIYLTTIPTMMTFAYISTAGLNAFLVKYLYPWSVTVFFSSAVINPYIYCYKNEHFGRLRSVRNGSQAASVINSSESNRAGRSQQDSNRNSVL